MRDLYKADLTGANLLGGVYDTNLQNANLREANLKNTTGITVEEVEKMTKLLQGATMPNGSIHP